MGKTQVRLLSQTGDTGSAQPGKDAGKKEGAAGPPHHSEASGAPTEDSWIPADLPGLGKTHLEKGFKEKVDNWMRMNKEDGIDLKFSSGFRTTKTQKKVGENNPPWGAAKPGTSLHEAGFAVDVLRDRETKLPVGLSETQWRKAIENARKAGLSWGGDHRREDPVHFYNEVPGGRGNRSRWIAPAQGNATLWDKE